MASTVNTQAYMEGLPGEEGYLCIGLLGGSKEGAVRNGSDGRNMGGHCEFYPRALRQM